MRARRDQRGGCGGGAEHTRSVGDNFNKQGTSGLYLKVYVEALRRLNNVYLTDSVSNTLLSQGCILRAPSMVGKGQWNEYAKVKRGSASAPVYMAHQPATKSCTFSSNNIPGRAAMSISYILQMRILRRETKFSNLLQIIIHLKRGRGGIRNQASLFSE